MIWITVAYPPYPTLQLPDKGKLMIKFKATQPVVYQDDALTDVEFKTM
jgi:hypothetical protein